MAMEFIATVATISSFVTLVEFSTKLVSRTVEISRSGDGALDSNNAIQNAADHLLLLKNEVEGAADSAGDMTLKNLCKDLTLSATKLMDALKPLKASGGKWNTVYKAVRSLWSREEIQDLERQLASLRAQMNLHINVKIRQGLTCAL